MLAESVQWNQPGPFGGLPTLAYARLFEVARATGVTVLLDGQGIDEQWAGYDYYRSALGREGAPIVQGTASSPVRPACLAREFRELAEPFDPPRPFPDALRNLQYRDVCYTKIPKATRFNDRVSMRSSTELREPFLDHRLFELAFRQKADRKISGGTGKWLVRRVASRLIPEGIVEAPKRALQTPQREWLRGELQQWVDDMIESALRGPTQAWMDADAVREEWQGYCNGRGDNSYFVWQWISLSLLSKFGGLPVHQPAVYQ
jgi:asparagine synthase (glutamine-hydrolysing)